MFASFSINLPLMHNLFEQTDRATMLDEIVDYVKFLRLQVKVLSMSRLGAAGAVAPLVTDIPLSSVEDETGERRKKPTSLGEVVE
ncbi:hypothetical protein OIU78_021815 [Salix suchowensis]|nr:hypothetical protein OIU78_021815 [Salix suchowensis]